MYYSRDTLDNIVEDTNNDIYYLNRPIHSPKRNEINVMRCNNFTKFYICIFSIQIFFIILVKLNILKFT